MSRVLRFIGSEVYHGPSGKWSPGDAPRPVPDDAEAKRLVEERPDIFTEVSGAVPDAADGERREGGPSTASPPPRHKPSRGREK